MENDQPLARKLKQQIALRFIKRNIKAFNKKVKETAYKTYVRPQLE